MAISLTFTKLKNQNLPKLAVMHGQIGKARKTSTVKIIKPKVSKVTTFKMPNFSKFTKIKIPKVAKLTALKKIVKAKKNAGF